MTRDILDSDVEYAQRLFSERRSDKEVAAALSLRGIEPPQAAKLVSDLRSGQRIRSKMILLAKRGSQRNRGL
jgi:hypothetical protein